MSIRRIVPNIATQRLAESRKFYTEFLGLTVAMDMDWIVTLVSPSNPTAQVSLLRASSDTSTADAHPISMTIEVADVDAACAKATEMGIPIIYPLTTEAWGVRRFHVTDPNGVVINVMNHVK